MENAVDALKMAAAVMTFVLALGISISSFSQARTTAQILLDYTDREFDTQYAEDTGAKERIVGKETIVHKLSYRCKICRCNFEVNIGEPRANEPRAN